MRARVFAVLTVCLLLSCHSRERAVSSPAVEPQAQEVPEPNRMSLSGIFAANRARQAEIISELKDIYAKRRQVTDEYLNSIVAEYVQLKEMEEQNIAAILDWEARQRIRQKQFSDEIYRLNMERSLSSIAESLEAMERRQRREDMGLNFGY